MRKIIPKNDQIRTLLLRIEKDKVAETSCEIARQLGRYKQIQVLREKQEIFIGHDARMRKSVVYFKKPVKQKGRGFLL